MWLGIVFVKIELKNLLNRCVFLVGFLVDLFLLEYVIIFGSFFDFDLIVWKD